MDSNVRGYREKISAILLPHARRRDATLGARNRNGMNIVASGGRAPARLHADIYNLEFPGAFQHFC